MPISDPTAGFAQQGLALLQLIAQLNQINRQRYGTEAENLIARQPAGATVAQVGLTPKQQKARYGRILNPTDVVTPETPESKGNAALLARINSMTPDELDAFTSTLQNKMQGTPGVTTRAGLASTAQAATTTAATAASSAKTAQAVQGTVHETVLAALDAIKKSSAEQKAQIGATAAGITTPAAAGIQIQQDKIKTEQQRLALMVLADPSHPLNKVMQKNLGFNAITAAGGVALGLGNLMDTTGRVIADLAQGNNALEVAKFKAKLDQDTQLNQAEADWAKDVAKNFGGTVSPRAVLNWRRWKEAGGVPEAMPQGVSKELDTVLSTGTALQQRAFVVDAASKGDPYANEILKLIEAASKVSNSNTLSAISQLLPQYFGRIQAGTLWGARPTNDPQAAAIWDAKAAAIAAKMPKLEANMFFTGGGVDLVGGAPKAPALTPGGLPSPVQGGALTVPQPPQPMQPPGGLNLSPQAGAGQISPEDLQALQEVMKALGYQVTPLPGTKPPGTP